MRISRAVASMSASDSRPLPRRLLNVAARRSCRVSNTAVLGCAYGAGARVSLPRTARTRPRPAWRYATASAEVASRPCRPARLHTVSRQSAIAVDRLAGDSSGDCSFREPVPGSRVGRRPDPPGVELSGPDTAGSADPGHAGTSRSCRPWPGCPRSAVRRTVATSGTWPVGSCRTRSPSRCCDRPFPLTSAGSPPGRRTSPVDSRTRSWAPAQAPRPRSVRARPGRRRRRPSASSYRPRTGSPRRPKRRRRTRRRRSIPRQAADQNGASGSS